ncbi:MAG: pilus assembly PilX N-terminal domain-containing protein [Candidatus Omnitrophica bacterium]|nr:pilus assembly PilX N-terminal domain-containing protein [Candidatus Omnitrophota bacterium]
MKKKTAFALLVAVIILVLFVTLGTVSVFMLTSDTRIAMDTISSTKALFLAEAGVQYAMEVLSNDDDWLDNTTMTKSMSGGTFTAEFLTKPPTTATMKFTGTVDGISRKFSANLFKRSEVFDYGLYVVGSVNTAGATNLTLPAEAPETIEFPAFDFEYYQSIATRTDISEFTSAGSPYNGLYFYDGNVNIGSDVVVNGGIISTININFPNGTSNVNINGVLPYPALATMNNLLFQQCSDIYVNGFIYVGGDMTGNFNAQQTEYITLVGTVIVSGNFNLQGSDYFTILYEDDGLIGIPGLDGPIVYYAWKEVGS